ncbi:type I restriction enzyme endonuclease domain-containing protein [Fundicoccus sp. Sow4_H7]|uniref:type I restriction enzyme endonuclease domain-containing protein n=1 Tax=Fundicoccus sp. Sow4_H7 TaxID=3438784 RepID=UPI003F8E106A
MTVYHPIANPENVQDFYTNEKIMKLSKELTQPLLEEMTADWEMKVSERPNIRRTIQRLLKFPGNYKVAINRVLKLREHLDGLQVPLE